MNEQITFAAVVKNQTKDFLIMSADENTSDYECKVSVNIEPLPQSATIFDMKPLLQSKHDQLKEVPSETSRNEPEIAVLQKSKQVKVTYS